MSPPPKLVPSVEKPSTIKDLGSIDITPLKALMMRLSETAWDKEDARKENKFDCFHHTTKHVIFRFIEGNRDHRVHYANPIWDIWKAVLLPVMGKAIEPYGFAQPEYPKVMFARLAAGKKIVVHTDGAGSNLHTHKIHVPLITNPEAILTTNGESFRLEQGRAYEVNNIAAHGCRNRGEEDRTHLIFEVFEAAK
jgi:hypothetical protein